MEKKNEKKKEILNWNANENNNVLKSAREKKEIDKIHFLVSKNKNCALSVGPYVSYRLIYESLSRALSLSSLSQSLSISVFAFYLTVST